MPPEPSPPRIRLAQVVRPAEGGIRRHVSLLISGLDASKFSNSLYAPLDFSLDPVTSEVAHTPLDIAPRTSLLRDLGAIRNLSALLKDQCDIVHAHGLRAALIGVIAANRAKIPAIFTAHNMPPALSTVQRIVLGLVSHRTAAILAVSEAISASLQACGVDAAQIHVIPNGIPLDDYSPPLTAARLQLGLSWA